MVDCVCERTLEGDGIGLFRSTTQYETMFDLNNFCTTTNIPLWLELLRAGAPIIAALFAGGVAIWFGREQAKIAKRQSDTAADKLKLDLYEKRVAVYEAANKYLVNIFAGSDHVDKEMEFFKGVTPAQWLFNEGVYKHLINDFYSKARALRLKNDSRLETRLKVDAEIWVQEAAELRKQLGELQDDLTTLFKSYLQFPN